MNEKINHCLATNGFQQFTPKAVLFDMDGILVDSMHRHARCWKEAMQRFGLSISEQEVFEREGMRGVEIIQELTIQQLGHAVGEQEAQSMYDEKTRLFLAEGKVPTMTGASSVLQAAKACGMKIVVVTGSGQRTLLADLQHRFPGLIDPGLIVSSFDVSRGKPHPEPYLKGLQKAGVEPFEAIVVENAPLGVRAAVAAKIMTVGVNTGPLPRQMLIDEGATFVFDTMDELADHGLLWNR